MIRVYSPIQHIEQTLQEIRLLLNKNIDLTTEKKKTLNNKIRSYHLLTDEYQKAKSNGGGKKKLSKNEEIIQQRLPTIDILKKFIIEIRPFYFNAQGHQAIFMRQMRKFNPIYDLLFHILVGFDFPTDKLVTYSYWDLLVIKLIVGWCLCHRKQIQISTLFQFIDQINGDKPWTPPRTASRQWHGTTPPPPPPELKRVEKTYNLKSE